MFAVVFVLFLCPPWLFHCLYIFPSKSISASKLKWKMQSHADKAGECRKTVFVSTKSPSIKSSDVSVQQSMQRGLSGSMSTWKQSVESFLAHMLGLQFSFKWTGTILKSASGSSIAFMVIMSVKMAIQEERRRKQNVSVGQSRFLSS